MHSNAFVPSKRNEVTCKILLFTVTDRPGWFQRMLLFSNNLLQISFPFRVSPLPPHRGKLRKKIKESTFLSSFTGIFFLNWSRQACGHFLARMNAFVSSHTFTAGDLGFRQDKHRGWPGGYNSLPRSLAHGENWYKHYEQFGKTHQDF